MVDRTRRTRWGTAAATVLVVLGVALPAAAAPPDITADDVALPTMPADTTPPSVPPTTAPAPPSTTAAEPALDEPTDTDLDLADTPDSAPPTEPSPTEPPPADAAPAEPGWIVSLGDSAISGEAGRWAGNTNGSSWRHDTGSNAYHDNAAGTGEQIPNCHRSRSAQVHIGGQPSLNLACSGARTYTQTGSDFKPGFDWYDGAVGQSQVVMLQEFASEHDVDVITVMVGANNFGFADIVQTCVLNWATSPWWWKNYCSDDRSITSRFTASAVENNTNAIAGALDNVGTAMSNAGYQPDEYEVIVNTYWSPVPRGAEFRYPQSGWSRLSVGGCGMWNRDANWANDTAVRLINQAVVDGAARSTLVNVSVLDLQHSLDGHRLCENTVGLLEEVGVANWTVAGAADQTEWVSAIRTLTTVFGPYQVQESLHANYWGQLAMRNCLRQMVSTPGPGDASCTNTSGVNSLGEPNMTLG